ncbi:MAG TPA: hypothetical protein VIL65_08990 [Beijerinckiaceae bacterium]|jgi:hypothetical protein
MRKALVVASLALLAGACSYRPEPTDLVRVWDSSADVNACKRLARLSGPTPTGPTFGARLAEFRAEVVRRGGNDLLLHRSGRDNAFVTPIAYRCPRHYSGRTLG